MMDGFRKMGQTGFGRVVIFVLFAFLILSFAVWGISDVFRGYGTKSVAKVGSTEIDSLAYRAAFQNELQSLSQRFGQQVTADQAIAFGFDRQVLGKLISEATLDDLIKSGGLALSDERIAATIINDSMFQGSEGKFDKNIFDVALRRAGLSEAGFVAAQRAVYLRNHITEGVSGAATVPKLMREAVGRFRDEIRSISYFPVTVSQIGPLPIPTDAELRTFFEARKTNFRAQEYRGASVLEMALESLADVSSVKDDEARARYEQMKATSYTTPEKRSVRQIIFSTRDEAVAAREKIRAGTSFTDIAAGMKLSDKDIDLGVIERSGIVDQKVADVAFSGDANSVSEVIDGQFGASILAIGDVQPAIVKAFDAVAPEIKRELATKAAKGRITELHDKIEDQRAAARPLAEIAKELNLTLKSIDMVDRSGLDTSGKAIEGLKNAGPIFDAIFGSEVGMDNEPVALRDGGYAWFEVTDVIAARDRSFEEARALVEQAWKEEETTRKVSAKASDLVAAIKAGKSLDETAKELGVSVLTVSELKRSSTSEELSQAVLSQAFSVPVGTVVSAIGKSGSERIVLSVLSASLPPGDLTDADQIDAQLKRQLADDMIGSFVARTQSDLGITINDAVLATATGRN
ncbi:MAG: SurA N-terminal domain-containing protein [Hyphomicrobiales bacterium]